MKGLSYTRCTFAQTRQKCTYSYSRHQNLLLFYNYLDYLCIQNKLITFRDYRFNLSLMACIIYTFMNYDYI